MTESVFQGRHLLSTRDYTKDELMWLIGFAEHLKDPQEAQHPAPLPRGQEHRAALREDLHAHPRRLHHRLHRPGRPPRVPGQGRHPARQEGDRQGHRQGPGLHVRRHRVPRLQAGARRAAGRVLRRARVERSDRPRAPHPDARRLHDHQGALRQARGPHARLLRPGAQQRAELPHDRPPPSWA